MPSSTFMDKETFGEKRYKKFEVVSSSESNLNRPPFKLISRDIEIFDNGTIVVRNKTKWWELEESDKVLANKLNYAYVH